MKNRALITLLTTLIAVSVTSCGKIENESDMTSNDNNSLSDVEESTSVENTTETGEKVTSATKETVVTEAAESKTETEIVEETTAELTNKSPEQVYMDFLNDVGKAQTSEQFKADDSEYNADGLTYGSYSFSELKTIVSEFQMTEMTPKYAFLDLGNDGTDELLLRFDSVNQNFMNWTAIIHNNNGNLELNSSYVDGYRTAAELYDNGYLFISGSSGAGVHNSILKGFNADGTVYDVFSFNEYYGAFAEEIEFTLSQNTNWEDNHHIPYESLIEVKEYIEGEKVKVAVVGGWSEDAAIKAEEEDFISYLESLGAELISAEEMNGLISIDSYKGNEVQWISHNS